MYVQLKKPMNEQKKIFEQRYADKEQRNRQSILAFIGSCRDMKQIAASLVSVDCPTPIKHLSNVEQFEQLLDSSMVSVDVPPIQIAVEECQLNPKISARMCSQRKQEEVKESVIEPFLEPAQQQQSMIMEPMSNPLESSFHEAKPMAVQAPTFRVATQSAGFMCGFQMKHINKVQSDIKALRTFRHNRQKTQENHYENTFTSEMDKMSKTFIDRIKTLEKALEESKLRQQSHLRTIDRLNMQVSTLTSSVNQLSRYRSSSLNLSEAEYLVMQNKTLREKLERRHNETDRDISMTNRVWGVSLPIDVKMKSKYPPVLLRHRYDLKTKKQILRNKDLLFKDQHIEVGYICSKQNGQKLTIFITTSELVRQLSTAVKMPKGLSGLTNNLHIQDCSPSRQQKQAINIALPEPPYEFQMPEMTINLHVAQGDLTRYVTLPVTIWKFVDTRSIAQEFKQRFKNLKANRYVSQEVTLSKKIVKNHRSLLQYIPKATILNPDKMLDFQVHGEMMQELKCKLKIGYETSLGDDKLMVKIVITPAGTLYVQCVIERQKPSTSFLVHSYLTELLALFGREKGDS